jgi:hypothetical protein
MRRQFESVWYATPERIESMTKLTVFSDCGSLDVLPDHIEYRGKEHTVAVRNVVAVSLTRQRIPWITYAIVNLAVAPCYAVPYLVVVLLDMPDMAVIATILVGAMVIASNLLGLLIGTSTKWVMVEYQDEFNQFRKAYFADGSLLGWGGILGGTTSLYRAINRHDRADG